MQLNIAVALCRFSLISTVCSLCSSSPMPQVEERHSQHWQLEILLVGCARDLKPSVQKNEFYHWAIDSLPFSSLRKAHVIHLSLTISSQVICLREAIGDAISSFFLASAQYHNAFVQLLKFSQLFSDVLQSCSAGFWERSEHLDGHMATWPRAVPVLFRLHLEGYF